MKLKQVGFAICSAMMVSAFMSAPVAIKAQQESVAEAARRARAEKKTSAKPVVVYSNDNLDAIKGTVSVVGQEPAPAPTDKTKTDAADDKAKTTTAPADKAPEKDEAYWKKQFAEARKVLADDAHELDILQREYSLKSQQYYSDPNVAMKEQYTNKDLNDSKKAIDGKTVAVAKDKQAISDLEDALRQAGGDPGWSR